MQICNSRCTTPLEGSCRRGSQVPRGRGGYAPINWPLNPAKSVEYELTIQSPGSTKLTVVPEVELAMSSRPPTASSRRRMFAIPRP